MRSLFGEYSLNLVSACPIPVGRRAPLETGRPISLVGSKADALGECRDPTERLGLAERLVHTEHLLLTMPLHSLWSVNKAPETSEAHDTSYVRSPSASPGSFRRFLNPTSALCLQNCRIRPRSVIRRLLWKNTVPPPPWGAEPHRQWRDLNFHPPLFRIAASDPKIKQTIKQIHP